MTLREIKFRGSIKSPECMKFIVLATFPLYRMYVYQVYIKLLTNYEFLANNLKFYKCTYVAKWKMHTCASISA